MITTQPISEMLGKPCWDSIQARCRTHRLANFYKTNYDFVDMGKEFRIQQQQRTSRHMNTLESASSLEKLLEREWCDRVSHHSLSTMYEKKFNKFEVLPLASDLKIVKDHLAVGMTEHSTALKKSLTNVFGNYWQRSLHRLVLFNKRRSGETSRLLVSTYRNRPLWNQQNNDELLAFTLSALLHIVATVYVDSKPYLDLVFPQKCTTLELVLPAPSQSQLTPQSPTICLHHYHYARG